MKTELQYLLPHHLISRLAGALANCDYPRLKSFLITDFLKRYPNVNLSEAAEPNPEHYPSFNAFFTRRLKEGARPIDKEAHSIASPADGKIAEIGQITNGRLIQAKGHDFSLHDLLGQDEALTRTFAQGSFATIYLAPHNYHRVHAPYDGQLIATHFIPGRLFSVNMASANAIPSLYSRNERLICVMENDAIGKIAVIFVGAMIVGSMQLVIDQAPVRADHPVTRLLDHPIPFKKGDELGHFKLGSTVILLFEKDKATWDAAWSAGSTIEMGMRFGTTTRR